MNYYIVCEGEKTELEVYKQWIPFLNCDLSLIDSYLDFNQNNFYMISGCGYPNYLNTIKNSIEDIQNNNLDVKLIIIVDAEDFTTEEKFEEINSFLSTNHSTFNNYAIVVQTPSIEGWCLGNKRFISESPQSSKLMDLINHYNVRNLDPELITPYIGNNKAQTSTKYLKEAAKEKNVRYTKNNPLIISEATYLENLIKRNQNTQHINNINMLLNAFQ